MILTSGEIESLGIVGSARPKGKRETTYDATVGEIILNGKTIKAGRFTLPKRGGMVWVVSHEEFKLPLNVTGLATLRTTWTHDGVLALNVGIVDPGWNGPLATCLVNFSEKNFTVRKGEPFFRVLFHKHDMTNSNIVHKPMDEYIAEISEKSEQMPKSFLNVGALAGEIINKIFTTPNLAITVAIAALFIAYLAIFVPIAYGISTEWASRGLELQRIKAELAELKAKPEPPKAPQPPSRAQPKSAPNSPGASDAAAHGNQHRSPSSAPANTGG